MHRLARLVFIPANAEVPGVCGRYQKLPVLPTKDIYVSFNEAIEGMDGKLHDIWPLRQRKKKE